MLRLRVGIAGCLGVAVGREAGGRCRRPRVLLAGREATGRLTALVSLAVLRRVAWPLLRRGTAVLRLTLGLALGLAVVAAGSAVRADRKSVV